MRKLIAAINITLDGVCDHTAVLADDETHQHYTELLQSADTILYGRKTYQLMEEYWPDIVKNPTDNAATNEFAVAIDTISKVVFSHTLKDVGWKSARVAKQDLNDEVLDLKQQEGRDILVGSPSLIISCLNLNLVDELQLCVHPVISAGGMQLFKEIHDRVALKLLKTKVFSCGAVILYYVPVSCL